MHSGHCCILPMLVTKKERYKLQNCAPYDAVVLRVIERKAHLKYIESCIFFTLYHLRKN